MSRNEAMDYISITGYMPLKRRLISGVKQDLNISYYCSGEAAQGEYCTIEEMRRVMGKWHFRKGGFDILNFSPKNELIRLKNIPQAAEQITITKTGVVITKIGKKVVKSFDDPTPLTTTEIHKLIEGKKVEAVKKIFKPKKATALSSVSAQSAAGAARIRGYTKYMSKKLLLAIVGVFVVIAVLIGRKI